MKGSVLLSSVAVLGLLAGVAGSGQSRSAAPAPPHDAAFQIVEAGLAEIRAALHDRRLTSRELVTPVLDPHRHVRRPAERLALRQSESARRSRPARSRARAGTVRGPLHGIPVALKDNIHTTNMPTTGGALVFAGYVPPYEATLTKNLRDAGAIIIAKAGLTELANWVAGHADADAGQLQRVGGFAFNPYDPRPDPREGTSDGRPALQTGDRARASAPRRASGPPASAPIRADPSSAPRTRTCWSASVRPSAASAGTA